MPYPPGSSALQNKANFPAGQIPPSFHYSSIPNPSLWCETKPIPRLRIVDFPNDTGQQAPAFSRVVGLRIEYGLAAGKTIGKAGGIADATRHGGQLRQTKPIGTGGLYRQSQSAGWDTHHSTIPSFQYSHPELVARNKANRRKDGSNGKYCEERGLRRI